MSTKRIFYSTVLFLVLAVAAFAVPRVIQYQGKLTDITGVGYNGNFDMSFRIFNAPTTGAALWTENHHAPGNDVPIVKGLFDVALGSAGTPINLDFHEDYWLEITVDGNILLPRVKLDTSPYAFRAAIADSVVGGSAVGDTALWEIGFDLINPKNNEDVVIHDDGDNLEGDIYVEMDHAASGSDGIFVYRSEPYYGPNVSNIFAYRNGTSGIDNGGTSWYYTDMDAAIKGYTLWGNKFTAAVAGYNWFDYDTSAAVLGGDYDGSSFGALGYSCDGNIYSGYFFGEAVHIHPIAVPFSPVEGDIYTDETDHNLYYHDGTSWVDLTAAGGGAGQWEDAGTYKRVIGNDAVRAYETGQDYGYRYVGASGGTVDIAGEFNTDWAIGDATVKYGVKAIGDAYASADAYGVYAIGRNYSGGSTGGNKYGVYGAAEWGVNNYGIYGTITNISGIGYAIYGDQGDGEYAGYFNGLFHIAPQAALVGGTEGDLYANSTDNNLYYHDGTSWVDLTSVGGGAGQWEDAGTYKRVIGNDAVRAYETGGDFGIRAGGTTVVPDSAAILGGDIDSRFGALGWNKLCVGHPLIWTDAAIYGQVTSGYSYDAIYGVCEGSGNGVLGVAYNSGYAGVYGYHNGGTTKGKLGTNDYGGEFDPGIYLVPGAAPFAQEGAIYGNSTDNNLYYHDGTSWVDLTGGGGGADADWAWASGSGLTGDIYHTGGIAVGLSTVPYQVSIADADTGGWLVLGNTVYNQDFSGLLGFDEDIDAGEICGFTFVHNGSEDELYLTSGCMTAVWPHADTLMIFDRDLVNVEVATDLHVRGNLTVDGTYPGGGGGVGGSGTLNSIPLWTPDGSTLGDSRIGQSATQIMIGGPGSMQSNLIVYCDETTDKNAIFGGTLHGSATAGTAWHHNQFSSGVYGLNEINATYHAGVVGLPYSVYGDHTAGVVGANSTGSVYGGLGYRLGGIDYAGFFVGDVNIRGDLFASHNVEVEETLFIGSMEYIFDAGSNALGFHADLEPQTDGIYNLGNASMEWDNLYIDGTAHLDAIELGGVTKTAWPDEGVGGTGVDNYVARWNGPDYIQTSGVYIDDSGNMGIGTTSPANDIDVNQASAPAWIRVKSGLSYAGLIIDRYATDDNGYLQFKTNDVMNWFVGEIGSGGANSDFSISTAFSPADGKFYLTEAGRLGIGTTSPSYKVDVRNTTESRSIYAENTRASLGNYGVYGSAESENDYQRGVYGRGSIGTSTSNDYAYGVYGIADANDGTSSLADAYGVYGVAYADDIAYGLYGFATSAATTYYGVYYSGGLGGSGTKSAIVRTEDGPKTVYCQESPENWFEDFGSAVIRSGRVHVEIAADFLQTVTISEEHPMKVFIQMENTSVDYKLTKNQTGFDIEVIGDSPADMAFDYRIAAKRHGYEDLRLKPAPHSYSDHYLYPTIEEVPQEWRLDWVKNTPVDRWDEQWFSYLTPDQYQKASELYGQFKDNQPKETPEPAPVDPTIGSDGNPIK